MVRLNAAQAKSEDDISGYQKPLPGRYHVFVKSVDESFVKFDKIVIGFEVLTGTVPGMEGREIDEFFACTDKSLPRLQRLALCVGLLKPGEADKDIDFSTLIRDPKDPKRNAHLVIEIEENKYTSKEGKEINNVRVGYLGMWSLGNKEVADVPKDKDAIAYWQKTREAACPLTQEEQFTKTAESDGGWDDM